MQCFLPLCSLFLNPLNRVFKRTGIFSVDGVLTVWTESCPPKGTVQPSSLLPVCVLLFRSSRVFADAIKLGRSHTGFGWTLYPVAGVLKRGERQSVTGSKEVHIRVGHVAGPSKQMGGAVAGDKACLGAVLASHFLLGWMKLPGGGPWPLQSSGSI